MRELFKPKINTGYKPPKKTDNFNFNNNGTVGIFR